MEDQDDQRPDTPELADTTIEPLFSPQQLRDINERLTLATLRADEEAEESADRYRDLVEGLDAIVWEAETDPWRFTFVSQRAEVMLGYAVARWVGEHNFWMEVVHPDDRSRVLLACQHATASPNDFRNEFRMVGADGRIVWLAMLARPHLSPSSQKQFRGLLIDVGDSIRAEALQKLVTKQTSELLAHQERLRALATELNLAEHRVRTALATELHDHLAQLLALGRMKIGQAQKARGDAGQGFMQQAQAALEEALAYTRTLVADLTPPMLHQFGLLTALQWLAGHMERYDLVVKIEGSDIPALALSEDHAILLFQSVRELLINIAKHADTGQAIVGLHGEQGRIRVVVRDEGRGFDLSSAFETGPTALARFGLFSIRERMKALGGSYDIVAAPGSGCTVTLTLPLEASRASKALRDGWSERTVMPQGVPSDQAREDASKGSEPATIQVLLVDDHAMVRQGLCSLVNSHAHFQVVGEAADGLEAIEAVRRLKPQVVIMDINMPRMNGIEATKRIKAEFPDLAIIGLSMHQATDRLAETMKNAGICRYVTKDSAAEALCQAIEEAAAPNGKF
jgi:PAS domain S-box-containing protein